METFLYVVAAVSVLFGLAGIILPLLPGTPLVFGGLWLAAWIDGFSKVGVDTVVVLGLMAVIAWAVEYVAAALGAQRAGASRLAIWGAVWGSLLGLVAGLPGLVIGPIVGAMLGEWVARRDPAGATKAGLAAGLGFVIAIAAKLGITLSMLGVFALAWFA